jgi:hypothetical protein
MGARPHGPVGPGTEDGAGTYDLDKLFRAGALGATGGPTDRPPGGSDVHMEAAHIAATVVTNGDVSGDDRTYLANLVASTAGITTDEAQKRVDTFVQSVKEATSKAKAAADEARKTAATTALFTALALLIGAFIASVAAAIGGRLRDEHT